MFSYIRIFIFFFEKVHLFTFGMVYFEIAISHHNISFVVYLLFDLDFTFLAANLERTKDNL